MSVCLNVPVLYLVLVPIVAAQTQAPPAGFRLIRSVSGPSGEVVGSRFVMDEVRSKFTVPDDKAVVVYFEWDGPPGEHELDGI